MSTRSITRFIDKNNVEIVTLYRHCDGYLEGHGLELSAIITGNTIVEGKRLSRGSYIDYVPTYQASNGFEALIPRVVTNLIMLLGDSDDILGGNIYLYPPSSVDAGEEYTYIVRETDVGITISCKGNQSIKEISASKFYDKVKRKRYLFDSNHKSIAV